MRSRPAAAEIVLTALLVALGALAFGWVFGWRSAGPFTWGAIGVGAVAPVAIGAALAASARSGVRRLPLVIAVQVLACLAIGAFVIAFAGGSASDMVTGLVDAWGSLISFTLPAGDEPTLLVVPIVLGWFAGALAVELTLRTRSPFAPALAAGGLLVAARLFGPGGPTSPDGGHIALAAVMVGVAVVLAGRRVAAVDAGPVRVPKAVDDPDADLAAAAARTARAGWLRAAAPVALAAAVLGAAIAVVLPFTRSAATLRVLHDPPPPQDIAAANPLDALTTELGAGADAKVLDLSMTVGAVPEGTSLLGGASPPLRLVTLGTFDGVEWSSTAGYRPAGSELPAQEGSAPATVEVRQEIELAAGAGPWLPAASWPRSVVVDESSIAELAFDSGTGGLVAQGTTDVGGVRYSVVSAVPAVTATELQSAGLPASADYAPAIALPPGMPTSLGAVAAEAMGRSATPFQQLVSLEAWLRSNGQVDLDAPGGSSYGAIERFLVPDPAAGQAPAAVDGTGPTPTTAVARPQQRVGTPQQFAEAFALLARSYGLPTRLVVGYRTSTATASPGTTVAVNGGDTIVWPESYLAGVGWVPFDPVPALGSAPTAPTPPQVDEVTQAKTDAISRAGSPDQSIPPASNPIIEAETDGSSTSWVTLVLIAVGVAIVVALALALGRPLVVRRRRARLERDRRRATTDRARVLGAWHHVTDALEAHGAPSLTSATVDDVARIGAERWGRAVTEPVAVLGALVNDTLFDPDAAAGPSAGAAGAEAWRLADAIVTTVAAAPPVSPSADADALVPA